MTVYNLQAINLVQIVLSDTVFKINVFVNSHLNVFKSLQSAATDPKLFNLCTEMSFMMRHFTHKTKSLTEFA